MTIGAKSVYCAADACEEVEDQKAHRCVRDRRELERGLVAVDADPSSANLRSTRGEMSLASGNSSEARGLLGASEAASLFRRRGVKVNFAA